LGHGQDLQDTGTENRGPKVTTDARTGPTGHLQSDLIHRYTRAKSLRDGVLIDVSPAAREVDFKYPVALTAAAWAKCVAVPPGVVCQDEAVRLWDVLYRLALAARRGTGPEVRFGVHVRNDNRERTPPLVQFKALCGPGDGGEPIITVMQPEED
jgi:hypothetical protein